MNWLIDLLNWGKKRLNQPLTQREAHQKGMSPKLLESINRELVEPTHDREAPTEEDDIVPMIHLSIPKETRKKRLDVDDVVLVPIE